jgi:hypothetical protein
MSFLHGMPENFDHPWVPATATINWMRDDPLLDWLNLYGKEQGFGRDDERDDYIREADFGVFIKRKGREFESKVIDLIDWRMADAGYPVCASARLEQAVDAEPPSHLEQLGHTIELMRQGVAVMTGGLVASRSLKVYGVPDLLVRSDVFHLLAESGSAPPDAEEGAPAIGANGWHYVVLDIKYRDVSLNALGEVDNGSAHYKVQLALYNEALAEMQGYRPLQAFLLARGWKKGEERVDHCLDCFHAVTLPVQPEHRGKSTDWLQKSKEALEWVRLVRDQGRGWAVLPMPLDVRLRPNMKNGQDAPWRGTKAEIAREIGEPTMVWHLGGAARNELVSQGHTDWRCPTFTCGRGQSATDIRRARMIEMNRLTEGPVVDPAPITWARDEWAEPRPCEFFVDFETTSNLDDDFSRLPRKGGQPLIFMIGCGHFEPREGVSPQEPGWALDPGRRDWHFRVFFTESLTEAEERRIVHAWVEHMHSVRGRLAAQQEEAKVFHWSPAETSTYSTSIQSAFERHGRPEEWPQIGWYDFLNRVVKPSGTSDACFVRGAWGFGLKAIGKALFRHGCIETEWKDGVADGLAAMGGSWACYRIAQEQGVNVREVLLADQSGHERRFFNEVIDYNEIDCKVMAEAIQFLRTL